MFQASTTLCVSDHSMTHMHDIGNRQWYDLPVATEKGTKRF